MSPAPEPTPGTIAGTRRLEPELLRRRPLHSSQNSTLSFPSSEPPSGIKMPPSAIRFATENNHPIGMSRFRGNMLCKSSRLGSEASAPIGAVCHRRYRRTRPPRKVCPSPNPQPRKLWPQPWQQSVATAMSKAATTTSWFAITPLRSCICSSSTLSRKRLLK